MIHFISIAALCSLTGAFVFYSLASIFKNQINSKLGLLFSSISLALEIVLLLPRVNPVSAIFLETRGDFFYLISVASLAAILIFSKIRNYIFLANLLIFTALIFFVSSSLLIHLTRIHNPILPSWFVLVFHVAPLLVSEIILLFSLINSLLCLIKIKCLKNKQLTENLLKEPSLSALSKLNSRFLEAGFFSLTIGLLSGTFWAFDGAKPFLVADLSIILSIMLWVYLLVILSLKSFSDFSLRQITELNFYVLLLFFISFIVAAILGGNSIHA